LKKLRLDLILTRVIRVKFFRYNNNHLCVRIVEDKDGERFLEIESDEDWKKFKEDLLRMVEEKAKDRQ